MMSLKSTLTFTLLCDIKDPNVNDRIKQVTAKYSIYHSRFAVGLPRIHCLRYFVRWFSVADVCWGGWN